MYSTRDAPHGTPLAFLPTNHTNAIIELVRFVRPYRSPFKTIENASCRFLDIFGCARHNSNKFGSALACTKIREIRGQKTKKVSWATKNNFLPPPTYDNGRFVMIIRFFFRTLQSETKMPRKQPCFCFFVFSTRGVFVEEMQSVASLFY